MLSVHRGCVKPDQQPDPARPRLLALCQSLLTRIQVADGPVNSESLRYFGDL
jgi:hypothetical protein